MKTQLVWQREEHTNSGCPKRLKLLNLLRPKMLHFNFKNKTLLFFSATDLIQL